MVGKSLSGKCQPWGSLPGGPRVTMARGSLPGESLPGGFTCGVSPPRGSPSRDRAGDSPRVPPPPGPGVTPRCPRAGGDGGAGGGHSAGRQPHAEDGPALLLRPLAALQWQVRLCPCPQRGSGTPSASDPPLPAACTATSTPRMKSSAPWPGSSAPRARGTGQPGSPPWLWGAGGAGSGEYLGLGTVGVTPEC